MRARRALVAAGALLVASPAAAASPRTPIPLPSALLPLSPQPPLAGAPGFSERRFPRRVLARERVAATVAPDGHVLDVRVAQRLVVVGKGDYTFVVPAPATDVSAGPESESEPGLRSSGIVWQGFSAGRRVLSAQVRLRAGPAGAALPLRLSLRREGGDVVLRIANATRARAGATLGAPLAVDVARQLDAVRAAARTGAIPLPQPVFGTGAHPEAMSAAAPLRISGVLVFAAATRGLQASGGTVDGNLVRFGAVLGDESPLVLTVRVLGVARGASLPHGFAEATPLPPLRTLTPPAGSATWVDAVRRGEADSGAALLRRAAGALLAYSRAHQYSSYLASPDTRTSPRTTYAFHILPRAPAAETSAARAAPHDDGGTSALAWALAAVGVALAAGGLTVLWAHL